VPSPKPFGLYWQIFDFLGEGFESFSIFHSYFTCQETEPSNRKWSNNQWGVQRIQIFMVLALCSFLSSSWYNKLVENVRGHHK
jgi:hypothetical protein